jgi:hypothetical protein
MLGKMKTNGHELKAQKNKATLRVLLKQPDKTREADEKGGEGIKQ